MTIIQVKKNEVQKYATIYKWSKYSIKIINNIAKEWLDNEIARSVLLFFSFDKDEALYAYMPLVDDIRKSDKLKVKSYSPENGCANIIGVEPYPLNYIEFIDNDTLKAIINIMENENYWKGNKAFNMCDKENIINFDISKPISRETIDNLKNHACTIYKNTGLVPKTLVRAIERMEQEYNERIGFTQCQLKSHGLVIRLESLAKKGQFVAEDLVRAIQNQVGIVSSFTSDNVNEYYSINYLGIVPGSSCLVGDFVVSPGEEKNLDKALTEIEKAEKGINTILEAAPILTNEDKTPATRVKEFKNKTGLNNKQAINAIKSLQKLRVSNQVVELISGDVSVKIDSKAKKQIQDTKIYLESEINPVEIITINGKLIELNHKNDDDLKFKVHDKDVKKDYNVHYSRKHDKDVKMNKGKVVTVIIERKTPNKPWVFKKWQ